MTYIDTVSESTIVTVFTVGLHLQDVSQSFHVSFPLQLSTEPQEKHTDTDSLFTFVPRMWPTVVPV